MALDDDKKEAITLLASEMFRTGELTLEDIADRVGVTPRTLYNWRQNPEFKKELEAQEEKSVDEILLERIIETKDPQAINLYYKRHGMFKDEDAATDILKMTDEERERIVRDAAEDFVERHGISALRNG